MVTNTPAMHPGHVGWLAECAPLCTQVSDVLYIDWYIVPVSVVFVIQ